MFVTRFRIEKAKRKRPKWKRTNTYKRLFNLGTRMSDAISMDLAKGIKTFKEKVSSEALYQAWKSGDYAKVNAQIPWEQLPGHLEKGMKGLDKTVLQSSIISTEALPAPIQNSLRFDTNNPKLADYIGKRTAENVVRISTDTQKIIQNAVARSFNEAKGPREVAEMIKGSIGLYPRQEQALRNYRNSLEKSGMLPSKVDKMTEAYNDRLLTQRSMLIARTETRMANNYGQLEVWKQALNDDLIAPDAKKIWYVDGDPCEICDPMDGEPADVDGFWTLDNGDVVSIPTESHPNCMCGMEIDFGQSKELLENNRVKYNEGYGDDE